MPSDGCDCACCWATMITSSSNVEALHVKVDLHKKHAEQKHAQQEQEEATYFAIREQHPWKQLHAGCCPRAQQKLLQADRCNCMLCLLGSNDHQAVVVQGHCMSSLSVVTYSARAESSNSSCNAGAVPIGGAACWGCSPERRGGACKQAAVDSMLGMEHRVNAVIWLKLSNSSQTHVSWLPSIHLRVCLKPLNSS